MKANLYYNVENNSTFVAPISFSENTVIENIGDNFKYVGDVDVPLLEEEKDSYYVYTVRRKLSFLRPRCHKFILHLQNKKFTDGCSIEMSDNRCGEVRVYDSSKQFYDFMELVQDSCTTLTMVKCDKFEATTYFNNIRIIMHRISGLFE